MILVPTMYQFVKIFNKTYDFLSNEELQNSKQSRLQFFESCVNQLLAVSQLLGCNSCLKAGSILLDIDKTLDKAQHQGHFYKRHGYLETPDRNTTWRLPCRNIPENFNKMTSLQRYVPVDVSQDSILGPLLYKPIQNVRQYNTKHLYSLFLIKDKTKSFNRSLPMTFLQFWNELLSGKRLFCQHSINLLQKNENPQLPYFAIIPRVQGLRFKDIRSFLMKN